MKKLFVCVMAAMVALASCSKTEMVETSAPQEIGFKAVTGKMTKGSQTTATFHQTLGVFAYVNDESGPRKYFTNAEFKENENSTTVEVVDPDDETTTVTLHTWEGTTPRYWPIKSSLDFIVYSPWVEGASVTDNVLSVIVADNSTNQYDFMYGSEYYDGFTKSATYVPVNLEHALALVTVKFTLEEGVTLTSAYLKDTYQTGTYKVNYSTTPVGFSWNNQPEGTDTYDLALTTTNESKSSFMVVPSTATSISISYRMSGMDVNENNNPVPDLKHTINLSETWQHGYHYTYNVSIAANAIKFVPTVSPWQTGRTTSDVTVE